jgi:membrane associated rhomboid family serine protease/Flp pilus assembly protein TadD
MANCVQCGRKLPGLTFGRKICQWCVQHEAAQRGEEGDDAKQIVMPAPWVEREATITLTNVIFGANVMVFIAMVVTASLLAHTFSMDFTGLDLRPWGANIGPYTLHGQWWRLLTYMFLHGGLLHIVMNMWCLWNLGTLCESLYGRWTYAAVYVITGVAGGLASVAWNPEVLSVGASGALFGLTGALIASFYLGEFSLSGVSIRGTLSSLLFFAGFSLFFGSVSPGIDNACHIGGLISGLILGALIARVAPEQDNPARRVGVLLFVVLLVSGSAFAIQRWRGPEVQFGRTLIDADRMIGRLQKKVQQNPQDASAHYDLARAYINTGQFSDGENEFKRVLDLQPQNATARMELGAVYLRQGQGKEAGDEFTKLAAQEPNNMDAHAGLGMALALQGNHELAVAEYKTALHLDPQARGVYYRMGISQVKLKLYDDAIASYLKEREDTGDDPDLENALADAYQGKGQTQQAQEARDRAAQLRGGQQD